MRINKFKINFGILIIALFFASNFFAQGVLPVQRYIVNKIPTNYSFGYSLRKINHSYTGFSVRVRGGTNGAEGDIGFDSTGLVSTGSTVTVAVAGTSGLAVGSVVPFSTFKGTQQLFVSIWYNQGDVTYNATQTTTTLQPELQLNTAGTSNTLPSIYFSGTRYLTINQPIQNILSNGIRGTFLLAIKPTASNNQFSFGYRNAATDWRWTFHINWSNNNVYFDSAEVCCAANRFYANGTNINLWKQYTFIRGTSYKTARIGKVNTALNNSAAASTAQTGGAGFGIGRAVGMPTGDVPYVGYMSEILMYNFDKTQAEVAPIETNQISFWKL